MSFASEHRPTQAVINLDAVKHNIQTFKKPLTPDQELYAVVKANAYGHGAVPVAKAALEAGVTGFCVATVDEAIALRQAGLIQVPILVMGLTSPYGIAEILHYNLTITVSDIDFFREAYQQLEQSNQLQLLSLYKLNVHLKLDTGMSRIGINNESDLEAFIQQMEEFPWVNWEGVYTHFSTAGGGPADYIEYQWSRWEALLTKIPQSVAVRHFSNTGMVFNYAHKNQSKIVRLGIGMYGIHPKDLLRKEVLTENIKVAFDFTTEEMEEMQDKETGHVQLQPALQLLSEISYVKQLPKGTKVSYGNSYTCSEDEWIATIPIGYADGWLRRMNTIPVLVEGQACPVVGVINMDQLMIKLPRHYPVGTEVTLIGKDGSLHNHPSLIARKIDTISYEIFTAIGGRVPRVYI